MRPFTINIDQDQVKDLKLRLSNTRWPDEINGSEWGYGTNLSYLKELCSYWNTGYSWLEQQAILNRLEHFKTEGESLNLHFIYQKGKGSKNVPLMLIHGWPDSFYRFAKLIPHLIEPDENGVAFDVIVPSIPGFGFSEKPVEPGMGTAKIAALFNNLMSDELGYTDYFVHGGDWGASIATQMAKHESEKIKGLHLTNVPPELFFSANAAEFGEEEKACLQTMGKWQKKEGAYVAIQSSKPQTIAYGLNDSPAGLASWIVEKFHSWSDCHGNIETRFTKEELLSNLSIYWFTQTSGSAARIYYETLNQPIAGETAKIAVPTHFTIFPKDPIQIPETFGRRIFNIKSWNRATEGGHFAAMEVPDLLSGSIRKAFIKR